MLVSRSYTINALFAGFACIVFLWLPVNAAVGGLWKRLQPRNMRPCFICPGSSVMSIDANNGANRYLTALMPEPIVRPCLYVNQQQLRQPNVTTQIVRGPEPGTPLSQGLHRIVLRVVFKDESDNSLRKPRHSYCRYSIKVVADDAREKLQLCQPPPSPDHGKVTCKSSGDDVTLLNCRYSCDEGYITPRSERHLTVQEWNCLSNNSQTPSCIKFDPPTPIDSNQCSALNLTVAESDDVQLPLPLFSTKQVRVDCDVNSLKAPSTAVIIKRTCSARNTETDATFNCTHDVYLNVDPAPERSMMLAELRFQIGQITEYNLKDPNSSWCDDEVLVERLMRATKGYLVDKNSVACRIANCTKFTTACQHSLKENRSLSPEERESLLDVTWTVTADYKPFSYEDYFYEGAEVPEGEMLIEKIKAETETIIEGDLALRREIETAGGRLLYQSFRLAKLDLICPLSGYIVNASTNQCQRCPENSYQIKGSCQPCPEGSYQDRPGRTECWPCSKRPTNSSDYYNARCQKRSNEMASHHPALAVLIANKHLIRSSSKLSKQLGPIAPSVGTNTLKNKYYQSKYAKKSYKKPVSKSRRNLYQYSTMGSTSIDSKNETLENDPCWPNPCLAGGTCYRTMRLGDNSTLIRSFKCSCKPGATGTHCETPYCPALYCLNGGTCLINHERFGPGSESRQLVTCECPSNFTGRRCEHRRRPTSLAKESIVRPRYEKKPRALNTITDGAIERQNSTEMGSCASNPCRNGGRCVDNSHATPGLFTCICPPKYQGDMCEYEPCPATIGRVACPRQLIEDIPYPAAKLSSRKRNEQCLIHTPTGRRECVKIKSETL